MNDWVTIAVLGRARGNRGELTAVSLCDKPERFQTLQQVFLFGDGKPYEVESVWWHDRRLIFKFQGIDSISAAQELKGAEVRIPLAERTPLEPGEYYQSDLIGCQVVERRTGEVLGEVTGWQEGTGVPLLEVGEHLLIPFARTICVEIDPEKRHIIVDLPDGLRDLND